MRLRWLERQIGNEFDPELSLQIDNIHAQLENLDQRQIAMNFEFLAGAIRQIVKKAAVAALQWFRPVTIFRAVKWIKATGFRYLKLR